MCSGADRRGRHGAHHQDHHRRGRQRAQGDQVPRPVRQQALRRQAQVDRAGNGTLRNFTVLGDWF